MEQWAVVRRMKRVEGLSAREISRRTGLARDTVSRLLAAEKPPEYSRALAGSVLDPFKDWICEQLADDASVTSQRLREDAMELGGPSRITFSRPASSGKTVRYRLNRGGDRQANNAIHTIAIIRAKHQPETPRLPRAPRA